MKLEVTHWGKTHKPVTSVFPEMHTPVFIHNSANQWKLLLNQVNYWRMSNSSDIFLTKKRECT